LSGPKEAAHCLCFLWILPWKQGNRHGKEGRKEAEESKGKDRTGSEVIKTHTFLLSTLNYLINFLNFCNGKQAPFKINSSPNSL